MNGTANEILLIDMNEKLAAAQAEDIVQSTSFAAPVQVSSGHYEGLSQAAVVLLCCGVAQRPGETRLQLLERNATIICPPARAVADRGVPMRQFLRFTG
jgi:L-lactate dehydrogenase